MARRGRLHAHKTPRHALPVGLPLAAEQHTHASQTLPTCLPSLPPAPHLCTGRSPRQRPLTKAPASPSTLPFSPSSVQTRLHGTRSIGSSPRGHARGVCAPIVSHRADPRVLFRTAPPSAARKGRQPPRTRSPNCRGRICRRGRAMYVAGQKRGCGQGAVHQLGRHGTHAGPAEKAEAAATTQARRAMRRAAMLRSESGNSS